MSLNSLFTGLSGIQVHQQRTNVVANNLANINTTGFKTQRANFEEQLAQTLKDATGPEGGVSGTNPVQAGTGVRLKSIDTNFGQGSIQTTEKNTDLALEGNGFFILQDQNGTQFYTRDGAFGFDADGRFVNPSNGMLVMGNLATNGAFTGGATDLQPIRLDLQQEIPGSGTTDIKLSGNLDPGSTPSLTAAASSLRDLPTPEKTMSRGSAPAANTRSSSPPETMSNPDPRRCRTRNSERLSLALTA